jgi:hypothetical protein
MQQLPVFDYGSMIGALDARRAEHGLGWNELANKLWEQSAALNARLADNCLCPGALVRNAKRRGPMTCQYALIILRWIGRAPEDFLTGSIVDVGEVRLPEAGPEARLRWDLGQLYAALSEHRRDQQLTWAALAERLECTPSRLTNLRTARLADLELTMRITQRLARPAALFIHPAQW